MRRADKAFLLFEAAIRLAAPVLPLLHRLSRSALNTEDIGRAMLNALRHGAPKPILEARDIRGLAEQSRT